MQIDNNKRKALTKVFINISGIVFGLLLVGPLVSERGFNFSIFIFGSILFFILLGLVVVFEPAKEE